MHAKLLAAAVLTTALLLFYTGLRLNSSSMSGSGLIARHAPRIVVVGSGLAGTAAALAAAEAAGPQAQVVVLEKEARPGGNSMKASSGINALAPDQGDSAAAFRDDTQRSGGGLSVPELVDAMVVRWGCRLAEGPLQGGGSRAGRRGRHAAGLVLTLDRPQLPLCTSTPTPHPAGRQP